MRRFKRRRVSIERLQARHFKLLAQFSAAKRCIKLPSRTLRERKFGTAGSLIQYGLQSIFCTIRSITANDQF
jgi:hypothetical protein